MLNDIEGFVRYFHGQRRRTQWVLDVFPPERVDWQPWPEEPTPGEILCQIAAGHLMYATVIAHDYWYVPSYEIYLEDWDLCLNFFNQTTEEALDLIRDLPDKVLTEKRPRPGNNPPTFVWRYLMAMLDHEIASRGVLTNYLMLLNMRRPNLGGVTIDAVRAMLEEQN